MGTRQKRTLAAWVLAALSIGLAPAACIIAPPTVHGPCEKDADCPDDKNPCTKAVCESNGFCGTTPQDLPFGDKGCDDENPCTDEVCKDGACAYPASNVPPDDGNECTDDICEGGQPRHTAVADNTACGLGGVLKCVDGKCNCTNDDECGMSTDCLKFTCVSQACTSKSLDYGALVDGNETGDCLKRVCDGANNIIIVPDVGDAPTQDPTPGNCKAKGCNDQGSVIDVADPTDKPTNDNNPCTTEGCNGGTPIDHEPVVNGTDCGGGSTCGSAGGGGYATTPNDKCINGTCTPQNPVSCGLATCNAAMTDCLATCQDVNNCIAGTYCDPGTSTCKALAGVGDTCLNQGECVAGTYCVDNVCCNSICNGTCQRCNDPVNKGICSPIPNAADPDNECPGGDACNGAGACAKPQGASCMSFGDCLTGVCEDNVCCDKACGGTCTRCDIAGSVGTCGFVSENVPVAGCDGSKVCDGGGNCMTALGKPCGSNGECLGGHCQDGVCCNSECAGDCARCDQVGSLGTCTNVPSGQQVPNCTFAYACDGNNACKKKTGEGCSMASECISGSCPNEGGGQKYCCDSACTGACQSCAGWKTNGGTNGTCDNIKNKTDPDDECAGGNCNGSTGANCCNGMGACTP